ncbi:spore Coat Protein U domain protein [Ostertagia ostertagi]
MSLAQQRGGNVESKIAQVNYSRDFGGLGYIGLVVFRDLSPGGGGSSIGLTWSRALDARHGASVGVQRQPNINGGHETVVQAQVQRNPAFGTGLGYQLMAETSGRQIAQAQWQAEHAVFSGGVARRGRDVETRAAASGGLAWLDGSVFAGRRIEGGIAVVNVGDYEGVRVLQDNQLVARTDSRGRAFVSGLRGYQPNRVAIEASDLPMDAELEAMEIKLTPAARSAARIDCRPPATATTCPTWVSSAAGDPMTRTSTRLFALLLVLFAWAGPARALCITGLCTCTLGTTNVAFGTYSPLAFGNTDTTGTVKVDCGGVVGLLIPFSIAISAGGSGSYANRQMKSGSNQLAYNLYTDASYTTVWGDGTSSSQLVNAGVTLDLAGLAPTQNFYVYGRIPGRQLSAVPGVYVDTISVTLTYY